MQEDKQLNNFMHFNVTTVEMHNELCYNLLDKKENSRILINSKNAEG